MPDVDLQMHSVDKANDREEGKRKLCEATCICIHSTSAKIGFSLTLKKSIQTVLCNDVMENTQNNEFTGKKVKQRG